MISPLKLPPHSIETEAEVLGACMLSQVALDEVVAILRPEHFYRDFHGKVMGAIMDLWSAREPVDTLTVSARMILNGHGDALDEISDIVNKTPHAANAAYHAGIVRELAITREIARLSTEALERVYDEQHTASDQLRMACESLLKLAEEGITHRPHSVAEGVAMVRERRAALRAGELLGLPTGLEALDAMLGGLGRKQLIVVAARPGMGKSALATQIASHLIMYGHGVLYFSMEMPTLEVFERIIAGRSDVSLKRMRSPWLLERRHEAKLERTENELLAQPLLWVEDGDRLDITTIGAITRSYSNRHPIRCLIVDYIQIGKMSYASKSSSRHEVVGEYTEGLRSLAKNLDIPVVALAQLNRESEKRTDKRPSMGDLRESGAIEAHADKIMLIHRPDKYDPSDKPGIAEIIVAKNRQGETGDLDLLWSGSRNRFTEPEHSLSEQERRAIDAPY